MRACRAFEGSACQKERHSPCEQGVLTHFYFYFFRDERSPRRSLPGCGGPPHSTPSRPLARIARGTRVVADEEETPHPLSIPMASSTPSLPGTPRPPYRLETEYTFNAGDMTAFLVFS